MTDRERRMLVVGGLVVLTLIVLGRGLPAWHRWQDRSRTDAARAAADRARADALLRVRPWLTDSLAARGRRLIALAPLLLDGNTPASAGASLSGLVSGAAAGAGVQLGAVQLLPVVDSGSARAFRRVAVRADAIGDVRGILHMLRALERGAPLLAVRALTITQPEPAAPADRMETLQLTVTVEGLMLAPRHERLR